MSSTARYILPQKSPKNSLWYSSTYLGYSSLWLLCGYVREVRSYWGQGDAWKAQKVKASLAKLERTDGRMHDLPKQNGVYLLPLPPLFQLKAQILRGKGSRCWGLWDRLWAWNFHANVLNLNFDCILHINIRSPIDILNIELFVYDWWIDRYLPWIDDSDLKDSASYILAFNPVKLFELSFPVFLLESLKGERGPSVKIPTTTDCHNWNFVIAAHQCDI